MPSFCLWWTGFKIGIFYQNSTAFLTDVWNLWFFFAIYKNISNILYKHALQKNLNIMRYFNTFCRSSQKVTHFNIYIYIDIYICTIYIYIHTYTKLSKMNLKMSGFWKVCTVYISIHAVLGWASLCMDYVTPVFCGLPVCQDED